MGEERLIRMVHRLRAAARAARPDAGHHALALEHARLAERLERRLLALPNPRW